MTRVTRLLRDLIATPSVNPAFRPEGDSFAGEARVAEFLAARARKVGLDVEFQEVFPGRSNVIVRLSPRGEVKGRVMLAPHMDTVGGDVEGGRLFEPVAKQGRLHGRGACDTKGSVAAMFDSLVRVATKGKRPANTELVFLGLVDEEHEQMGSRHFAEHGFKADLAIVGEPTRLRVVTAHKGDFWLRLQTRGRSAHGSQPHRGRNAVHAMAKLVDVLETDYAELLRQTRHPLLGSGTVNVGTIQGGAQANVVPNECSITIDRNLATAAHLVEGQKVSIVNINNGERLDTYVIYGAPDSGEITLNGPAARKVQKDDLIIIISYAAMTVEEAKSYQPVVLFPDESTNRLN